MQILMETKVNNILDYNFTEGLFSANFPAAVFALKEHLVGWEGGSIGERGKGGLLVDKDSSQNT